LRACALSASHSFDRLEPQNSTLKSDSAVGGGGGQARRLPPFPSPAHTRHRI
jgi:hypothetical protein